MSRLDCIRRVAPPYERNQKCKHGVGQGEDPERSLEVHEALDPVLDEAGFVLSQLTGLSPEPLFKVRERAMLTEPSLRGDEDDGRGVSQAERPAIDPTPSERIAEWNDEQTADHEHGNREVDDEGEIGGSGVRHVCIAAPNAELTGRRRKDAKPGPQTMYRVPAARAWWPAVGAPVERPVRPHELPARRSAAPERPKCRVFGQ